MKILGYLSAALLAALFSAALDAQEKIMDIVEFDKTVYNFGDVMLSDGKLECTFTVKNISSKPVIIHNVVTSCGCTDVKWTREPLLPGKTGTISATYTNDEGPYPFDKSLTAYISGIGKPVILRMRGVSHNKKLPLNEMYPVHFGPVALKNAEMKCGNIEQGESRTEEALIANISSSPAEIGFKDLSPGLSIKASPNPIPPGETSRLIFTVTSDRNLWGKNFYHATPVVNGKSYGRISVYAFTKENFGKMTQAEKADASRPMFSASTYSFGKIKAGTPVDAEFSFKNIGKADFIVYKADADTKSYKISDIPVVKCGFDGSFKVQVDTSGLPAGETLIIVTLTTNSPSRPIVNLFITGWIE